MDIKTMYSTHLKFPEMGLALWFSATKIHH
jgi:hypothetical protein